MVLDKLAKVDRKEFEVPKTVFSRDIESRVIQVIILYCIGKIAGVAAIGGGLIDTLLGREEKVKGIHVEQDSKNHSVKVSVEINVDYGVSLPEKSEEVQLKVVQEISDLTGLHVSSIHVVVKGLIPPQESSSPKMLIQQ